MGTCNAGNPHFLRRARHAQNVAGRNVWAKRLDFSPIRWLTKVVVDWTRGLADSSPASQVVAFHAGLTIVWELTEEPGGTATIKSGCGFRYREARREAIRHTTARLQGAALESVDALREI